MNFENMDDKDKEIDIFRNTPVRYLGYANEVGEAFRSLVPKSVVWSSYAIASGYVLADTLHKGYEASHNNSSQNKMKHIFLAMSDTLLWQSLASVIIPGITINKTCALAAFLQKHMNFNYPYRWLPTFVGLVSIPLIIHPIDYMVERSMNRYYRRWTGYYPNKS